MKANLKMEYQTVKVLILGLTIVTMKDNLKLVNTMVTAAIHTQTAKTMKVTL